jgi:hypothetical protein
MLHDPIVLGYHTGEEKVQEPTDPDRICKKHSQTFGLRPSTIVAGIIPRTYVNGSRT